MISDDSVHYFVLQIWIAKYLFSFFQNIPMLAQQQ